MQVFRGASITRIQNKISNHMASVNFKYAIPFVGTKLEEGEILLHICKVNKKRVSLSVVFYLDLVIYRKTHRRNELRI